MKVNRINVEISRLANKHRPYLYNEMFSLAKEHQIQGEFGNDFISLRSMPENLLKVLEDLKIKFRKMGEWKVKTEEEIRQRYNEILEALREADTKEHKLLIYLRVSPIKQDRE